MAKPNKTRAKKKDVEKVAEKGKKRTIDLLPADVTRLSALRAFYLRASRVDIKESAVMRLALQDACIHNGLEQRDASTVEPMGTGS